MTCKMDSGSITGCRPVCDQPAEYVVTYHNGSYGPFRVPVCAGHVATMEGRAYPGHVFTSKLEFAGAEL